jgi:hypothetical protein
LFYGKLGKIMMEVNCFIIEDHSTAGMERIEVRGLPFYLGFLTSGPSEPLRYVHATPYSLCCGVPFKRGYRPHPTGVVAGENIDGCIGCGDELKVGVFGLLCFIKLLCGSRKLG